MWLLTVTSNPRDSENSLVSANTAYILCMDTYAGKTQQIDNLFLIPEIYPFFIHIFSSSIRDVLVYHKLDFRTQSC